MPYNSRHDSDCPSCGTTAIMVGEVRRGLSTETLQDIILPMRYRCRLYGGGVVLVDTHCDQAILQYDLETAGEFLSDLDQAPYFAELVIGVPDTEDGPRVVFTADDLVGLAAELSLCIQRQKAA